ncbi:hypothetical protein KK488_18855 [Sphingobium sp. H33]|uniref:Response regulatory domain-containing protein n=1 Tax=Sphingobium nicotianae TaxID=2782607 RepID=A0A9X1DFB0_9SPHN|nr:hypothetical protein [Sphingobium nicotianae]
MIAMNTEILLLDLGVAEVKVAASLAGALALIETTSFDFAILDVNLGEGENCLPIAERLTRDGVRFAFATGMGDEMVLPEAYGDAMILKKPYGFEDLAHLLSDEPNSE